MRAFNDAAEIRERRLSLLRDAYRNRSHRFTVSTQNIYGYWERYKAVIPVAGAYDRRADLDEINLALDAIRHINRYHPEWLSTYLDLDQDMYHACARQSEYAVSLFYEDASSQELVSTIRNLRQLAHITRQTDAMYPFAVILLLMGLAGLLLVEIIIPQAVLFFALYSLLINLLAISGLMVVAIACGALIGLSLSHPSSQGDIVLANALSELAYQLELHSAAPVLVEAMADGVYNEMFYVDQVEFLDGLVDEGARGDLEAHLIDSP